eukprot:3148881-Lingulodinium_polyedra.AAC.1
MPPPPPPFATPPTRRGPRPPPPNEEAPPPLPPPQEFYPQSGLAEASRRVLNDFDELVRVGTELGFVHRGRDRTPRRRIALRSA